MIQTISLSGNKPFTKMKAIVTATLLLSLLTSVLLLCKPASAQTQGRESITLAPASKVIKTDPGKTINGTLTIVNDGQLAYDFLVYARPYSILNNEYSNPDFTQTGKYADLYGWVQFAKTTYSLDAGQTIEVPYTIRVPENAAPGGHYGVIFAETQPKNSGKEGSSVLRKKRVGSIIYATVNGDYKLDGKAGESNLEFWQVEPPLKAQLSVQNTGNTDFENKVKLTVSDVFGKVKYQTVKDYRVLPDTTRTFDIEWDKASWFGFYKVEAEQQFLGKFDKREGFVLMMPRYIPFVLLIVILIGGVYAMVRRRKK